MKTLVIIDDEIFFRKSVCNFLNKQNICQVIGEANNGRDGIDLIRRTNPDIALVDISMPVMNGLEMIQAISTTCHTRFILSTGFEDFEYARQAISLGVKEYLLKPLDNGKLLECLEKISREIDAQKRQDTYIGDYFQTRDSYMNYVALDFFHKSIAGNCQPEEFSVLKKQIGNETADTYLVLLLKINPAEPSVWNTETDFSLLHFVLKNVCTEIFSSHYPLALYVDDSRLHQYMILGTDTSAFDLCFLGGLCSHLTEVLQDTVQIPVTIFSGTPHSGDDGIRRSYEEARQALQNHSSENRKSSFIQEVQNYIDQNFHKPNLRLETIAAHFYVSPQYLSSLFSQESQMTLTTYITAHRMQKAKELLLEQSPSIQNTAALCGFTDSGYFSKCFRKYYGISPKNFLMLTAEEKNRI